MKVQMSNECIELKINDTRAIVSDSSTRILDCDGDTIMVIDRKLSQSDFELWYKAYARGYAEGEHDGMLSAKSDMRKALGL